MMTVGPYARTIPAKGFKQGGVRRVSMSFDDRMFERIRTEATMRGVSFNTVARDYIRAGMKKAGS